MQLFVVCFSCIFVSSLTIHLLDCLHKCRKNTIKTAYTGGLRGDKHMMLETCIRHQELNKNINLKSLHFVVLYYVIVSQYTVQNT